MFEPQTAAILALLVVFIPFSAVVWWAFNKFRK